MTHRKRETNWMCCFFSFFRKFIEHFFSAIDRNSSHFLILSYQTIVHLTILNSGTNLSRHNGSALCLSRTFCRCIRHKFAIFFPLARHLRFQMLTIRLACVYAVSILRCCIFCVLCIQCRWRNPQSVCLQPSALLATFIQCISQFYHTIIYQYTLHLRSSRLPYTALVLIESCPIVNFVWPLKRFGLKLEQIQLIAWSYKWIHSLPWTEKQRFRCHIEKNQIHLNSN